MQAEQDQTQTTMKTLLVVVLLVQLLTILLVVLVLMKDSVTEEETGHGRTPATSAASRAI